MFFAVGVDFKVEHIYTPTTSLAKIGYVHLLLVYGIGAALFFIFVDNIQSMHRWEWLTIPIVFLVSNIFEWFVHRYVMHRRINIPGLKMIYDRHTLTHHQFFTDSEIRFLNHRDWRVTVFPTAALVGLTVISIPLALGLGYLVTPNVGWLAISTIIGMYLTFDFVHFCCHVDENWFVANFPFVNTLRRHHTAHHNTKLMMEVNMNLTFPIADWLFKTSDLDRGLLGHLFNGYNTAYLRTDLRATPRSPTEATTGPVTV